MLITTFKKLINFELLYYFNNQINKTIINERVLIIHALNQINIMYKRKSL